MNYYDKIDPIGEEGKTDYSFTELKLDEVEDLEVDGVDAKDYPEFCDAFFSDGYNLVKNRDCTEDELIYLTVTYPELLNEMAYESLI